MPDPRLADQWNLFLSGKNWNSEHRYCDYSVYDYHLSLLTPLQIKQQKMSKMMSVMQPDLQRIEKKYQNKKDQASQMKKSEETMAVYQKYGVSPTGSCSTLLVQMPILLALYQVIYHIPGYIGSVRNVFQGLTTQMMGVSGYSGILTQFITDNRVTMYSKVSETLTENNLLDMFYVLKPSQWTKLADISEFSGIADTIQKPPRSPSISTCSLDLILHSLRWMSSVRVWQTDLRF